jgi:hypothetical protein
MLTWGLAGLLPARRVSAWLNTALSRRYLIVAAAAVFAALAAYLITAHVYEYSSITIGDECSYRFHARLFATGRFYAEPPPVGEPFRNRAFVCTDHRWYGIGFGGHPLALSVGYLLGCVYLVPWALAGVSVVLTFLLVRELYDPPTAVLAAVMTALSPLYLFHHASLLPETTNLALVLGFLILLTRAVKRGGAGWWIGAAIVLAAAVFVRPQTTVIICVPIGVWLLVRRKCRLRSRIRDAAITGLGGVAGVLALFTYSHLVSGEPFGAHLSPGYHQDEVGGAHALGIEDLAEFTTNSAHTVVTFLKMNFVLLGWPLSLAALYLWLRDRRKTSWDLLLFACAAAVVWFYWMYADQLEQYFVEGAQFAIILGAAGIVATWRSASPAAGKSVPAKRHAVACFVLSAYVVGAASVWPFRVEYFRGRSSPERLVWAPIEEAGLHNAIVFLHHLPHEYRNCVGSNSPELDDDVILARVRRLDEIPAIAAHFPRREVYRMFQRGLDGPLELVRWNGETESDASLSGMAAPDLPGGPAADSGG